MWGGTDAAEGPVYGRLSAEHTRVKWRPLVKRRRPLRRF